MLKSESVLYKRYLVDLLTITTLKNAQIDLFLRIKIANDVLDRSAQKYQKKWHESLKIAVSELLSK